MKRQFMQGGVDAAGSAKGCKIQYNCNTCDTLLEDPQQCSRCKNAFYCDAECQKLNWSKHKPNCNVVQGAQQPGKAQLSPSLLQCFNSHTRPPIQRYEPKGGLCYMQAPIAMQHYLVEVHQPGVGMLDLGKMMRQHFTAVELKRYIFTSNGGSSVAFLRKILLPGSVVVASEVQHYEEDLNKFHVGLVSMFAVHEDFHAANSQSFDGAPQGNFVGHHAMVLIGVRCEPVTGKRWFLLQNWWKNMEFVQVSEQYLLHCKPTIYFVHTPQLRIPSKYGTLNASVVEFEDKAESLEFEGAEREAVA